MLSILRVLHKILFRKKNSFQIHHCNVRGRCDRRWTNKRKKTMPLTNVSTVFTDKRATIVIYMYGLCLYITVMPKNNVSVHVKGAPRQWIFDRSDVQRIFCVAFAVALAMGVKGGGLHIARAKPRQ